MKYILIVWIFGVTDGRFGHGQTTEWSQIKVASLAACEALAEKIRDKDTWTEEIYGNGENKHRNTDYLVIRTKCIQRPEGP